MASAGDFTRAASCYKGCKAQFDAMIKAAVAEDFPGVEWGPPECNDLPFLFLGELFRIALWMTADDGDYLGAFCVSKLLDGKDNWVRLGPILTINEDGAIAGGGQHFLIQRGMSHILAFILEPCLPKPLP